MLKRRTADIPSCCRRSGSGGWLELVGGALVLAGLCTRVVAPQAFWPIQNHGEAAVLFCFIFLFFAAHGAGPFSLDALWRRRKQRHR